MWDAVWSPRENVIADVPTLSVCNTRTGRNCTRWSVVLQKPRYGRRLSEEFKYSSSCVCFWDCVSWTRYGEREKMEHWFDDFLMRTFCNLGNLNTRWVAQSLQCVTTDWTTGFDPRQRQRIFPLTSVFTPALRLTQPAIQWVPGVKRWRGLTLTTHPI
jgi:hypothetical protein